MCGIFGIIAKPITNSGVDGDLLHRAGEEIFYRSETRGKDASGAYAVLPARIEIVKSAERVPNLMAQPQFTQLVEHAKRAFEGGQAFVLCGHTRMVTNGTADDDFNNQPVIKDDYVLLHNGIIVNDEALWAGNPGLDRQYKVDTEIFGALLGAAEQRGENLESAIQSVFSQIKGANTIATLRVDRDELVIATSNGSMYFWYGSEIGIVVFASERLVVEKAAAIFQTRKTAEISQLRAGNALFIAIQNLQVGTFALDGARQPERGNKLAAARSILQIPLCLRNTPRLPTENSYTRIERLMHVEANAIRQIRRCTKCLVPETFPNVTFDQDGACDFCRNQRHRRLRGADALTALADRLRRTDGKPDCLVPISGGRDSCYGLHYIKKDLGLNPVAYTYDWGFVTDLARRNISRMCGELGVEHVLVAANIRQKRENVRSNVEAWLQKPSLGMIPLFMAGDKMFFYFASLLRSQMDLNAIFFSMNWLEKTGFKTGFANVHETSSKQGGVDGKTYEIALADKLALINFYGRQFLFNPAYWNRSIPDTLFAFMSYYLQKKDYDSIFDFLDWNEDVIVQTIVDGYDWEISPDTRSTWRIGDGTAPFYNYIYLTVAGFSEHDTFRSNQIREGMITRDEAMNLIEEENRPRVESFKWYCDTIGLDAVKALEVINRIPKMYRH